MRALVFSALLTVENLRRSTSRTLLVTLGWIEFGCVHKSNRGISGSFTRGSVAVVIRTTPVYTNISYILQNVYTEKIKNQTEQKVR